MDKQTLEVNIIAESHRPDKAPDLANFIRRTEDRIARSVRAIEMLRALLLTETERTEANSPIYKLPLDFLEDRELAIPPAMPPFETFETPREKPLTKVASSDLRLIRLTGPVRWYALKGDADSPLIEFRGTPALDSEIHGEYFAKVPRLVNATDTNRLLENHESLYLAASMFELYRNTQDLKLAQAQLDIFDDTVNTLNALAGRFFGGTRFFGRRITIGDTVGRSY